MLYGSIDLGRCIDHDVDSWCNDRCSGRLLESNVLVDCSYTAFLRSLPLCMMPPENGSRCLYFDIDQSFPYRSPSILCHTVNRIFRNLALCVRLSG